MKLSKLLPLILFCVSVMFFIPQPVHADTTYTGTINGVRSSDTVRVYLRCDNTNLTSTQRTGSGNYGITFPTENWHCKAGFFVFLTDLDAGCTVTSENPTRASQFTPDVFNVSCTPLPTSTPTTAPIPPGCTFTLTGKVIDEDLNTGLSGASVLVTKSGTTIGTPSTNSSGNFSLSWTGACVSSAYNVSASKSGCTTSGFAVAMGGSSGYTKNVTIGLSCGNSPPALNARILSCVIVDYNNNGLKDSGDYYVGNNSMRLYNPDGSPKATGATASIDGEGCGCFGATVTSSGIYKMERFTEGYTDLNPNPRSINVTSNTTYTADFLVRGSYPTDNSTKWCGYTPPTYTINVRSFNDTNSDGIKQSGESYYSGTITANIVYAGANYGNYSGSGLISLDFGTPGTANVTLQPVSGYSITSSNPQSKTTTNTNKIQTIEFGIHQIPPPTSTPTSTLTPTRVPTSTPTTAPTNVPTSTPTTAPTNVPTSTPTTAPTSTLTPTVSPSTYTMNIRAFIDSNNNGVRNPGESAFTNTISASITYSGVPIGTYSGAGAITLSFGIPGSGRAQLLPVVGYTISSTNPQTKTLNNANPTQTYDFGLVPEEPTSTPTPTVPAGKIDIVRGTVYIDLDNNTCSTPHRKAGVQMRLYKDSGAFEDIYITDSSPVNYTLKAQNPAGNYRIVVDSTQTVKGVRDSEKGDSGFDSVYNLGYLIGYPRDINDTVDFCLEENVNRIGWFRTSNGSVRIGQINNPVPSGKTPSTNDELSSVFYSTLTTGIFGSATNSTKWRANSESVPNVPTAQGHTSFSYYKTQATAQGVTLHDLPTCDLSNNCTIDNPTPDAIYYINGDMTIMDGTNHIGGTNNRVLILVNGNVTIRGKISVDNSNLFILAVKGDITIDPQVGEDNPSSTTSSLDGIYTAQGSIIISGTEGTTCPAADKRININGSLIANSLAPYRVGQGGKVILDKRTLCSDNDSNPVITVQSRYDFLNALTNFYKFSSKRWLEVEP